MPAWAGSRRRTSRGRTVSASATTVAGPAKFSPRLGVALMCVVATMFASNHVSARISFDHGASVGAAVLMRLFGTALVLLVMMRLQGVQLTLPRSMNRAMLLTGICVATQSYCLFSAVARIPAVIALLVFHTSPMLYVLVSWATKKESPRLAAFVAIVVSLCGLSLALDVGSQDFASRWERIGPGVAWSFGGSVSFVVILYANSYWLKGVDGRVRTFFMTAIAGAAVLLASFAVPILTPPRDAQGWLGLVLLTMFYCTAMCILFFSLPRLHSVSTVALNFEPIALLFLAWIFLGQAIAPVQIIGAFVTVGAIAWLSLSKPA